MRIFFQRFFLVISIAFLTSNCASNFKTFPNHVYKKQTNHYQYCSTAEKYSYLKEYKGSYKEFNVTIHSQVELNKDYLNARDAAKVFYLVYKNALTRFPYAGQEKLNNLHGILKSTKIIVNVNNDYLQNMWVHSSHKNLLAQTIAPDLNCFNNAGSNWFLTIVEKAFKKQDIDTVVHESMHITSWVLFGNIDETHKDPRFWDEFDKEYHVSLQGIVKSQWK